MRTKEYDQVLQKWSKMFELPLDQRYALIKAELWKINRVDKKGAVEEVGPSACIVYDWNNAVSQEWAD